MKRINYILQAAAIVALASCTAVEEQRIAGNGKTDGMITVVEATVNAVTAEGTRSSLDDDFNFIWNEADKLGFIPDKNQIHLKEEAKQLEFSVVNGGSARCSFTGDGWGLLRNLTYYAYYPYSNTATAENVSVNYNGQCMPANSSTEGLGAYDFLHATVTVAAEQEVSPEKPCEVSFSHLGSIAVITFEVPNRFKDVKFAELELSSDENIFHNIISYNPSQSVVDLSKAASTAENTFCVNLGADASGVSADDNDKVKVLAMMCPADFSGKTINAKLIDRSGAFYTGTISGQEQTAGNVTYYEANMDWPAVPDISAAGGSNCYLISAAGTYKFKPTKGCTSTAVGEIAKAEILWMTTCTGEGTSILYTDFVTSVEYTNEEGQDYIYFTTNGNKGNAIIVARDGSNNILWSWHIWCTDINTVTYGGKTYLDRNLGALDVIPYAQLETDPYHGSQSAGLFYQWGRKDPFIGGERIDLIPGSNSFILPLAGTYPTVVFPNTDKAGGNYQGKRTFTNECMSTSTEYSFYVSKPTRFAAANCNDGAGVIGRENTISGFAWGTEKTVNDPCPVGYKVPDAEGFMDFIQNGGAEWPYAGEISGKYNITIGTVGWTQLAAYQWTNDDPMNRILIANPESGSPIHAGLGICIPKAFNNKEGEDENRILSGGSVRCQKIQ